VLLVIGIGERFEELLVAASAADVLGGQDPVAFSSEICAEVGDARYQAAA
jgi:hypothetical protein